MSENTPVLRHPWLNHYDPETPRNLDIDDIPLYGILEKAAEEHPDNTAVIFKNWRASYKQLLAKVEICAANLRNEGVRSGDRVAIMLPNVPQCIIAFWAALKCGAVVVMTNPLYMEKEIRHQLRDSGAKYLIVLDRLWPKIEHLRDDLPVEKYFVTRISDCLKLPYNVLYRFKAKKEGQWPDIPFDGETVKKFKPLMKGKQRLSGKVKNPAKDLALLQYTGGTTGVSKGAMLSHRNLVANVQQCQAVLHDVAKNDNNVFLGVLPYFHVYGLTVGFTFATSLGATLVPLPRFVPGEVLRVIDKYKPTIFPGSPTVYMALTQNKKAKEYDLSSVEYCISGSAPMPVEKMKEFTDITGGEIIEGYGLTEASPVTHINPLAGTRKTGSIGLPFPETDCRIVDMEFGSVPLPPGKVGELVVKGPQVMQGYWNRPDETAGTLRNGWLYTGDIAKMDPEGYFYIVDRKKDMIITGGYNVYPREIDEVLYEHEKIKEAVSLGVPHKTRGEVIKACVVLKSDVEMTKNEVIEHCRKRLAGYKVPKMVEFREDLPKNFVGKVLRRVIREEE